MLNCVNRRNKLQNNQKRSVGSLMYVSKLYKMIYNPSQFNQRSISELIVWKCQ
jgi:hypothetical protein